MSDNKSQKFSVFFKRFVFALIFIGLIFYFFYRQAEDDRLFNDKIDAILLIITALVISFKIADRD